MFTESPLGRHRIILDIARQALVQQRFQSKMCSLSAFVSCHPATQFTATTWQNAQHRALTPRSVKTRLYEHVAQATACRRHRQVLTIRRVPRACTEKPPLEPPKKPEQTFFGLRLRTNGDVLKFGVIATAIPFGIKAVLQAGGTPDLLAGQITTGFVSIFALLAWVSTYVFRVGTKQMTYAQQLREYENQVLQKRYEELSEDELAALKEELDDESSSS